MLKNNPSAADYGAIRNIEVEDSESTIIATRQRWRNILIIALCTCVGDSSRGIFFPTLWLFVKALGGDHIMQGKAVALFSAGRIVSSPLMGLACEKYGYRKVLFCSNVLIFVGAAMWASTNSLDMLFAAQFTIGAGSGILGVTRAYIAERAPIAERTSQLALLTAVQYGAFTVLPLVGALLADIGRNMKSSFFGFPVDEFSVPAAFIGCIALLCACCMIYGFSEDDEIEGTSVLYHGIPKLDTSSGSSPRANSTNTTAEAEAEVEMSEMSERGVSTFRSMSTLEGQSPPNYTVIDDPATGTSTITITDTDTYLDLDIDTDTDTDTDTDSVLAFFANIFGCVLNMSTKGTIGVYETLGTSIASDEFNMPTHQIGLVFAFFGVLGVCSMYGLARLAKSFSDVDLMIFGISIMVASTAMMSNVARLHEWQFHLALFFMYSIGYPIGHTAVLGAYSKIAKNSKQAFALSLFAGAGSVARVFFPLLAGYLTELYADGGTIFSVMTAVLIASNVFITYQRSSIISIIS